MAPPIACPLTRGSWSMSSYRGTSDAQATAARLACSSPTRPVEDGHGPRARRASTAGTRALKGHARLSRDTVVWAIQPEIVPGLSSIEVSARRPDGGTDVLLALTDPSIEWPTPYLLKTPRRLARGTDVFVVARPSASLPRSAGRCRVSRVRSADTRPRARRVQSAETRQYCPWQLVRLKIYLTLKATVLKWPVVTRVDARRIPWLLALATLIPIGVLTWPGVRTLRQDRDLQGQRQRERLEWRSRARRHAIARQLQQIDEPRRRASRCDQWTLTGGGAGSGGRRVQGAGSDARRRLRK